MGAGIVPFVVFTGEGEEGKSAVDVFFWGRAGAGCGVGVGADGVEWEGRGAFEGVGYYYCSVFSVIRSLEVTDT